MRSLTFNGVVGATIPVFVARNLSMLNATESCCWSDNQSPFLPEFLNQWKTTLFFCNLSLSPMAQSSSLDSSSPVCRLSNHPLVGGSAHLPTGAEEKDFEAMQLGLSILSSSVLCQGWSATPPTHCARCCICPPADIRVFESCAVSS